jgi:hypothetical protein
MKQRVEYFDTGNLLEAAKNELKHGEWGGRWPS